LATGTVPGTVEVFPSLLPQLLQFKARARSSARIERWSQDQMRATTVTGSLLQQRQNSATCAHRNWFL
jgi:hypothetical protein